MDDLTTGIVPAALQRPLTSKRKGPRRPSEIRRRRRRLSITFSPSHVDAIDRLGRLAVKWGWICTTGKPNVSRVAEFLLLSQIEAAERGEIAPPVEDEEETGEQ